MDAASLKKCPARFTPFILFPEFCGVMCSGVVCHVFADFSLIFSSVWILKFNPLSDFVQNRTIL